MPMFTKKQGAVGWPGPQARQIERWSERYNITVREHFAQTGTRYLTLTAPDDEDIVVRVADHADAYATADFTVDPAIDQRKAVKAWIEAHGEKQPIRRNPMAVAAGKLRRAGFEVDYTGGQTVSVPGKFMVYPWGIGQGLRGFDADAAARAAELLGVEVKPDE